MLLMLIAIVGLQTPTNAAPTPLSRYLDCIEKAAKERASLSETTDATADAVLGECQTLFPDATAYYAATMANSDMVIDYRARYIRSHGRDPDLTAAFAPGFRSAARGMVTKWLAGAHGTVEAEGTITLPNPDK